MYIAKECRSVSRIGHRTLIVVPCIAGRRYREGFRLRQLRCASCSIYHEPTSSRIRYPPVIRIPQVNSVIIDGKKQHAQILSHQSLTGPRQRSQKQRDIHHSPTPSIRACRCPLFRWPEQPCGHGHAHHQLCSSTEHADAPHSRSALARRANLSVHRSGSLVVQFHGAITFPACGLSNRIVLLYLDNLFCCRAPRKCATEKYSMCVCGFSHGIQLQESNRFKRIKNGIGCALRYHANGQEKI